MAFKVAYKASVAGDLKWLDKPTARRLIEKLERTLAHTPQAGIPLSRVGDYRAIYAKTSEGTLVLRIRHRKDMYR